MIHLYSSYGVALQSDTALPGLAAGEGQSSELPLSIFMQEQPSWVAEALCLPQRVVRSLPEEPETADPAFLLTDYGDEAFFQLAYSDGTRFILDGAATKMWACYADPYSLEYLTTYFVGPVMGFVLRRRKITALHASAVAINDRAIVLCGPAGAGKSTTAAALALRGVPVLCEDVSALRELNGEFTVMPGYPRVCLWPSSVEMLFGKSDALPRLVPTWEKCYLPLDDGTAHFERDGNTLSAIYLLMPRSCDERCPRVGDINAREAVLELVQNTYMNAALTRKQRAAEFDLLTRLASQVQIRCVFPHENPAKLTELCDLILSDAADLDGRRTKPQVSAPI